MSSQKSDDDIAEDNEWDEDNWGMDEEDEDEEMERASQDEDEDMTGYAEASHMHSVRREPYTVLNEKQIEQAQEKQMEEITELTGVSKDDAFILLKAYGWDKTPLQEAWFDNETKARKKAGLVHEGEAGPSSATTDVLCPICLETVPFEKIIELPCSHPACRLCWQRYLEFQVEDGKAAVETKCPQHKCGQKVPSTVFEDVCDEEHLQKYKKWCVRSFVDDNSIVQWCPKDCGRAVMYPSLDNPDVKCDCEYNFCFCCSNEAHRPSSCKTVQDWELKNSAESENVCWIMANTKQCPQCNKNIEKNTGCNHMTCSKNAGGCGHEFCWLCLGPWKNHGSATGGYYQCNVYEQEQREGKKSDAEEKRLNAKKALDKYMFYFERFMNHDKALRFLQRDRAKIEEKVQELHDKHHFAIAELQFLYDACAEIAVCRRVLKWSYPHGYYLEDEKEKHLFEFLQKNLEEHTDLMHEQVERGHDDCFKDMEDKEGGQKKFMEYRSQLSNYTLVVRKFLNQMLEGIKNGLTNEAAMIGSGAASSGVYLGAGVEGGSDGASSSSSGAAAAAAAAGGAAGAGGAVAPTAKKSKKK